MHTSNKFLEMFGKYVDGAKYAFKNLGKRTNTKHGASKKGATHSHNLSIGETRHAEYLATQETKNQVVSE